jgi:hypothetical protein
VKAAAMLLPITLMQSMYLFSSINPLTNAAYSCQQYRFRSHCTLGRPLSRMHPLWMGDLGCWAWAFLDT